MTFRTIGTGLRTLLAIALLGLAGSHVLAADDKEDISAIDDLLDEGERCVSINRIDSTEILDRKNILFHMRGGQTYLNRLPNNCPGLRRSSTIMYKTSLSELCNVDIITVLDNIGFGFSPGASCGLGKFHPVTDEVVEALKSGGE